jgi:hypothetical protein
MAAAMTRRWLSLCAVGALGVGASCDKLEGLGGSVSPLATIQLEATADPGIPGEHLQFALVWGMQWLPEALCTGLVPETGSAQAVIDAGCRDPFGFVPQRVETNVPAMVGTPTTIELYDLPGADVLVGDITARVAYGSLVLYDDVNNNGNLDLARANRINAEGASAGSDTTGSDTPTFTPDIVIGASFISMTEPDTRLAYREGAFVESAFYPRHDCSGPTPGFSIVGAGGFTAQSAIAATLAGSLPPENPADCTTGTLADTVVAVGSGAGSSSPLPPSVELAELACTEFTADSSVRYREPQTTSPDFTGRQLGCVPVPSLNIGGSGSAEGSGSAQIELIVTGNPATDSCVGLTHYVLKGCADDPNCASPDWDHSLAPPTWWPCPPS